MKHAAATGNVPPGTDPNGEADRMGLGRGHLEEGLKKSLKPEKGEGKN